MGVPSYFGWIMRQIKKFGLFEMVHYKLTNKTSRLYFDFNCLIHRACRESQITDENSMINNVIRVLKDVIDHVNPTELVYISIDGSVPMGKCKQQRFRRFKSIKEAEDINQIYQQHNISRHENKNSFDFNAISPGTKFMNNLAESINQMIVQWSLQYPSLNFILSDSHQPGEGEHKIMQHIKNNSTNNQIVIYGLDADLIFLSLGLHYNSTFLFRENLQQELINGVMSEYLYLNIGELYQNIVSLIIQSDDLINLPTSIGKCYLNEISRYDAKSIINDYIFFNFFLGNDFVNRVYSLSIRNNGCEILMQIYRYCLRQQQRLRPNNPWLIASDLTVNLEFLQDFLEHVAEYEEYWWNNPSKSYTPKPTTGLSQIETEVSQYGIVERYLSDIGLNLSMSDFKSKYYHRLFNMSSNLSLEENIQHICHQYWSTIRWTLNYYLSSQCCDWDWYFEHEYAPLIDDFIKFIKHVNNFDCFNQNSQPIDVYHQLMIILPPKSYHLLPEQCHCILKYPKFSCYFPKYFDFHYYGHRFLWECPPKIPILDNKVTQQLYQGIKKTLSLIKQQ